MTQCYGANAPDFGIVAHAHSRLLVYALHTLDERTLVAFLDLERVAFFPLKVLAPAGDERFIAGVEGRGTGKPDRGTFAFWRWRRREENRQMILQLVVHRPCLHMILLEIGDELLCL